MSTFTTNKNIEKPASGSFNNAWAAPVNADWDDIDNAFGGHTTIDVTGVPPGVYQLSLAQCQPPNITIFGTATGNITYVLPAGVGGIWTIFNNVPGSPNIGFGVSGGNSLGMLFEQRTLVVSNGAGVDFAETATAAAAIQTSEAFATAADAVVTTNANAFATGQANSAQAAAIATAANASNLSSGTVPNAQLPNIGNMPGVTIAADPGTTPSGSPGQIFFYY